jgi:nucleoside 2-deoxyribosyltransferase
VRPTVYLAGPITGLTYDEAVGWRAQVRHEFAQSGIECFSPLRGQRYLQTAGELSAHARDIAHLDPMVEGSSIFYRDRADVENCDLIFINLIGAKQPAVGTAMEAAFANILRKRSLLIMERDGNPAEHVMLTAACMFRAYDLNTGMRMTKEILLP